MKADPTLRETEALFQETFDLAAVGIGHLSPGGRWLRANRMLCEILGYGRTELLERSLEDLLLLEERDEVRQNLEQMLRGEVRAVALEAQAVRKDGFPLWVSLTMSPVLNAAGTARYLVAIIEDITGRRRMEDGLRLFRTAVQSLPQGITISDMDGRVIYTNAAEARMHGYTVDELLGKETRLLAPPSQRDRLTLREMIARNLLTDIPFTRETQNIRRDGTVFPVLVSSVPVRDMRGTPLGLVSVSEDITGRKRMLETLQESERKYRSLFESANDAIFIADQGSGLITDCNAKAGELLGMPREEIIGMHRLRLHPSGQAEEYQARFASLTEQQPVGMFFDNIVCREDGKQVWVDISSTLIETGGKKHVMGIFRDVSQRKLAEQQFVQWISQLRESEARFRDLADLLPQPVYEANVQGVLTFVNRSAMEHFGLSPDDLAAGLHLLQMIAPDDRDRALDMVQRILRGESAGPHEYHAVRKDGGRFPVLISSSLVVRDGRPAGLRGIVTDITERKRTEEEVRQSRERLQLLIDRMPLGCILWDKRFRVELWNPMAESIFGFSATEAAGRHPDDLIVPPEARQQVAGIWKRILDGDVSAHSENENITKDGRKIYCSWYNTPLTGAGGEVVGALSMVQDITERRKIENAIAQAKQDWENTFDTITDMITIHDEHYTIVRTNKAASEMLGLPWNMVGKAKCYEYYHGTDSPPEGCPSCESLRTGLQIVQEKYEPHLGRFLEIRAIPRRDQNGRVIGLIHVVRDITDRKRDEEEKAALQSRLRDAEKMEAIGSLAGGVAHEVRNPLNAIMALTDALDREVGGNPEYRTYMQHMRTQVDRLTTLMNDLLELGKPVERSTLHTESLTEICAISVDAWKQSKWGRGREVEVSLSREAQGAYILADAKKLQQVFINLLDNAAQHSPEGAPVRIDVPPPAGGRAEVRIVDQGRGVPAEILPRIFDTFFTTRRGGTGLGLSIVKHIIEKHGGSITLANNDPPPGCTASVMLPVLEVVR